MDVNVEGEECLSSLTSEESSRESYLWVIDNVIKPIREENNHKTFSKPKYSLNTGKLFVLEYKRKSGVQVFLFC